MKTIEKNEKLQKAFLTTNDKALLHEALRKSVGGTKKFALEHYHRNGGNTISSKLFSEASKEYQGIKKPLVYKEETQKGYRDRIKKALAETVCNSRLLSDYAGEMPTSWYDQYKEHKTVLIRTKAYPYSGQYKYEARRQACLVGFEQDEKQWWCKRIPATTGNIKIALDFLVPAKVKKAKKDGLNVLRQGDVYLVERKTEKKTTKMFTIDHDLDRSGFSKNDLYFEKIDRHTLVYYVNDEGERYVRLEHPEHIHLQVFGWNWKIVQQNQFGGIGD